MESFAVVLISAVLLLGFLFLATSLDLGMLGGGKAVRQGQGAKIDLASMSSFFVGFTKEDKARTVNYDAFTVGAVSSLKVKEVLEQDISNGLFSANELNLDVALHPASVSEAASGSVSFDVADTNNYGNLVVQWNGKEYFNGQPAVGKVSVKLPKESLKESNKLAIKSTGPGARFWAASVYALKNVRFEIVTIGKRSLFFDVFPEEIPSWSLGVINFNRDEFSTAGDLAVSVNGKTLYDRFPRETDTIEIGPTEIRPGTNVLAFESRNATFSLKNVFLNVFLWRNRTAGVSKYFQIGPDEMFLMNSSGYTGVVQISVGKVLKAAPLEVKFSNRHGSNSVFITELKDKVNATFGPSQVTEGNNNITMLTDGSMGIDSVEIFLQGR